MTNGTYDLTYRLTEGREMRELHGVHFYLQSNLKRECENFIASVRVYKTEKPEKIKFI
jgi:hypothetical protein